MTKCSEWPENPAMVEEHKVNNLRLEQVKGQGEKLHFGIPVGQTVEVNRMGR